MMPLNLQPAITPSPIDGTTAQSSSKDSDAVPSLSFGAVLQVEEKKLQQEQAISAPAMAAVLAAIQLPVLMEPILELDLGADTSPDQTSASTIPMVDPGHAADSSFRQDAPLNSNETDIASRMFAVELSQTAPSQMSMPAAEEMQSSDLADIPTVKEDLPNGASQVETGQINRESQFKPVTAVIDSSIKVDSLITTSQSENVIVEIDDQPESVSKATVYKSGQSAQAPIPLPKVEVLQAGEKISDPFVKPFSLKAAGQSVDVSGKVEEQTRSDTTKLVLETDKVVFVQDAAPNVETSDPAENPGVQAAKAGFSKLADQGEGVTAKVELAPKAASAEVDHAVSSQSAEFTVEISQPANLQSEKTVFSKAVDHGKSDLVVETMRTAPAQTLVSGVEVSLPVEATMTDTNLDLQSQPEAKTRVEVSNKDGRSVTSSNVEAENLLGAMVKPRVGKDAPVREQGNVQASIRSGTVEKSQEAGIRSDERELRKSDLKLDATAAVAGVEKGSVDTKAVGKPLAMPIDTTALDVIRQITSQMKMRIGSGETSIRMTLNPKELGAIEVRVTHGAQGVSVSFITEQASTGQLIESQAGQLRQSLKDAGVQLGNLNISQQHQFNQQGGFRQSQLFSQGARRDVPREEVEKEIVRPQRIDGLTSEIDYFV